MTDSVEHKTIFDDPAMLTKFEEYDRILAEADQDFHEALHAEELTPAERKRIQRNTCARRNYNRKMLLFEYLRKNSLMSSTDPFEVTIDVEYVNPYDGYHHERLKYLVTDPTIKNFNPETIKAKLLMKCEISSEMPSDWGYIPKVYKSPEK